jgi:hypothetical protein
MDVKEIIMKLSGNEVQANCAPAATTVRDPVLTAWSWPVKENHASDVF